MDLTDSGQRRARPLHAWRVRRPRLRDRRLRGVRRRALLCGASRVRGGLRCDEFEGCLTSCDSDDAVCIAKCEEDWPAGKITFDAAELCFECNCVAACGLTDVGAP